MKVPSLRAQAAATVAVLAAGFALVFFYAPLDAEGFIQKIFYLHVPLAICSLVGFVVAGIHAIRHLRTGDPVHDARSYVSIHLSVIFGVGVLLTGSIWARAEWGKWWVWDEPTLVSFLIVFLLYATYYPLRYAIEDRERQARYASVFAITAGAFVPLNFLAVRMAEPLDPPADLLLRRRPARLDAVHLPASAWRGWRSCGCRWCASSWPRSRPRRSCRACGGRSRARPTRRRPPGPGSRPAFPRGRRRRA